MKGGESMVKTVALSLAALVASFVFTVNIVSAQTSTTTPTATPSPTTNTSQSNTNSAPGAPNTGFGH